jgi:hypothetical protein
MSELKHLNLTEKDFDLLVEGLDSLPEKGIAGELMGDLLHAMLSKDDSEGKSKFQIEREKKQKDKELKQREMKEDIKILQGKLLMLKRYLIHHGALNETCEIINHIS